MKIDYPVESQLPDLRILWKEAFGDEEAFLDLYFDHIFSPDRCRCVTLDGDVAAALYWLDCRAYEQPMAYIYAVATAEAYQGQGLCRALMADAHALLKELGYAGCLLVPGDETLFEMYSAMGYRVCSTIREFDCKAGGESIPLRQVTAEQFRELRLAYLPEGGVVQEGESLAFLSMLSRFYAGEDLLLCCAPEEEKLFVAELLGNVDAAPAVLAALGYESGTFRAPGQGRDFAMYHPLSDTPVPKYFAFAFD